MTEYMYDVAVLGGGPGGYECAIRCAQYGLKTVLIEARELGGTCLNRGCIPTKALLQSAHTYEAMKNSSEFGVFAEGLSFDYKKMAERKDSVVLRLRSGIQSLQRANGVTVKKGFGVLRDKNTIDIDGETVSAKNIILATGSAPVRPPIPGIDGKNILTSDEVLSAVEAPKDLVIIGGGVIGIEFATLFSALGKNVTVLEMMPEILPGVDSDIVKLLTAILAEKNVKILTSAKVLSLNGSDGGAAVEYELKGSKKTAEAAVCVVCVGRCPMTKDLGLEALGVNINRGFVEVDDYLRTSVPNIYAIGDITGKIQLAHVASSQGLIAAANCAGKKERMDYSAVPACIFTEPEIAFIGLSEEKAKEKGPVRVGTFNVAENGKAMALGQALGLVKIVSDASTGEILGAQIFAPRATEMIAEIAAIMNCEGTIEELSSTIHPHPTVSEILKDAAHDTEGMCCNSMPKKKKK
jgi:dihydrolipoamide dehydrogenase